MRKPLFGFIENPCTYGWENMEGRDTVGFCKECKPNVYNLSYMTEEETTILLESGASLLIFRWTGRHVVRMVS